TSFQRVYGAVITKSHFCASAAEPILTSLASPSKRSMTMPFASGKCLSGSASTTRPTVHFQPLAADLYALDLLTSSLNALAHSFEKALTAICPPRSKLLPPRRLLRAGGPAGRPPADLRRPCGRSAGSAPPLLAHECRCARSAAL